jgi:hypothetical protein
LCLNRDEAGTFVVLDENDGARLLDQPRAADPRQTAVVQLVLDLPALQPYLHLELEQRRPVRVRLDDVVPLPLPVTAGGARVAFLPPELLRDDAHVAFTKLSFAGQRVVAKFALAAEGVAGELVALQSPGGLVVASSDVHERLGTRVR